MRVVLQRVSEARVRVEERVTGEIGAGLLLLCAFRDSDGDPQLQWMADKLCELRIFRDDEGKMNRSLRDLGGGMLVVSQFTLYGDARKGRRPSFIGSAPGPVAERLYDRFIELLRHSGLTVETGEFAADMKVELVNDGPVTLTLDRDA
jgi:D-tyrosyl-tRNA(Tyr) deacylase